MPLGVAFSLIVWGGLHNREWGGALGLDLQAMPWPYTTSFIFMSLSSIGTSSTFWKSKHTPIL